MYNLPVSPGKIPDNKVQTTIAEITLSGNIQKKFWFQSQKNGRLFRNNQAEMTT